MTAPEPEFRDFTSWLLTRLRDADSLPGLIDLLGQCDEGVRESALMTLVRYGRRARRALSSAANHHDVRVRNGAKIALDMIEGRQPIPEGGTGRSPLWFAEAAWGQMQPWRVVPELIAALDDREPTTRENATFALGAYDHPDVIPALIESVSRQSDYGRATVAQALGRRADLVAVPLLLDLLRDQSDVVCEHAAGALGRFAHQEIIETLLARLDDSDPRIRRWSAFALGEMGAFSIGQVLDELERASDVRRKHLVHAALRSRCEQATPKLVALLFDDEVDYDLRVDIVAEFKEFDANQVVDVLRRIAARDPSALLGRMALNSVYCLGARQPQDRPSREGWSESLQEQANQAHRRYIERIGNVRPRSWPSFDDDRPIPLQKIHSVDRLVQRDGFLELAYSGPEVATDRLLGELRGWTASGRVHAINAGLQRIPIMSIPMFFGAIRSHDPIVRRATVDALVQIGEPSIAMTLAWIDAHWFGHYYLDARFTDEIETFYVPRLIDLLADPRALVRRSAAEALGGVRSAHSVRWLRERTDDSAVSVRSAVSNAKQSLGAAAGPRYVLRLHAVLGGGAFEEVGAPYGIVWNDDRSLVAVMSGLPDHAWYRGDPLTVSSNTRVAIYDADSLSCRGTFDGNRIRSIAFHPTEPILAVGTGGYNGGYAFQGCLYLWHFNDDIAASVFERRETGRFHGSPEICRVQFDKSGRELVLTARYVHDYKDRPENTSLEQTVLSVEHWRQVRDGQFLWHELERRPVESDQGIPNWIQTTVDSEMTEQLSELAASADREYQSRWSIWSVGWDARGNVVALHRDDLEVWSAEGTKATIYTSELSAVQLLIAGERTTAWINTSLVLPPTDVGRRSEVIRIDLETGESSVIDMAETAYVLQVVDDRWLVGEEYAERYKLPKRTVSINRDGTVRRGSLDDKTPRALWCLDSRKAVDAFQIRSRGYGSHPRMLSITRISPTTLDIEWLFPFPSIAWSMGGYLGVDDDGTYVVLVYHSGTLSRHRGLQRVNVSTGEVVWSRSVYAGIDVVEPIHDLGLTAFAGSQHFGLIDNRDGTLIDYQPVLVDEHPTSILSMSSLGNRVACGTVDGRILTYSVDDPAS